jgi:prevent-host-death family protein
MLITSHMSELRPPRSTPCRNGRAPGHRLLYRLMTSGVYDWDMDVAITELRAHLGEWLERVRGGDEVVITDRGVPVARLLGLTTAATLERLAAEGVIGRPVAAGRPRASGRSRPRSRRPLADIVSEQRG